MVLQSKTFKISFFVWNGSVCTAQLLYFMVIELIKILTQSRLTIPEISGYHCTTFAFYSHRWLLTQREKNAKKMEKSKEKKYAKNKPKTIVSNPSLVKWHKLFRGFRIFKGNSRYFSWNEVIISFVSITIGFLPPFHQNYRPIIPPIKKKVELLISYNVPLDKKVK